MATIEIDMYGDGSLVASMPLPHHSGWRASAKFVPQDTSYVVASCTVEPEPDSETPIGGVTAKC